jgi:hypothetical protein
MSRDGLPSTGRRVVGARRVLGNIIQNCSHFDRFCVKVQRVECLLQGIELNNREEKPLKQIAFFSKLTHFHPYLERNLEALLPNVFTSIRYEGVAMPRSGDATVMRCHGQAMPRSCDATVRRCHGHAMPRSGDATVRQMPRSGRCHCQADHVKKQHH